MTDWVLNDEVDERPYSLLHMTFLKESTLVQYLTNDGFMKNLLHKSALSKTV